MAKAHGAFWDRSEAISEALLTSEGLLEALRGLRRVSSCQKALSEGHKTRCRRRCEALGGFQGAKKKFRRVIKEGAGGAARP